MIERRRRIQQDQGGAIDGGAGDMPDIAVEGGKGDQYSQRCDAQGNADTVSDGVRDLLAHAVVF